MPERFPIWRYLSLTDDFFAKNCGKLYFCALKSVLYNPIKLLVIMKKVFMAIAIVAAMAAAVACSCNNSKKAEACCEETATECCCDSTKCADCTKHCCDSTATCDSAACCTYSISESKSPGPNSLGLFFFYIFVGKKKEIWRQ